MTAFLFGILAIDNAEFIISIEIYEFVYDEEFQNIC